MIEGATIGGRPAFVAYLNDKFEPVERDEATFAKAIFTDDKGGSLFLVAREPQEKEFDESKHPRGKTTPESTGGSFAPAEGGGGEGKEAAKPAAAKPKGKKAEWQDFAKTDIEIDYATSLEGPKQKKFLDVWNDRVQEAPEDFKKEFLGGLKGTMKLDYNDRSNELEIRGKLQDARGNTIGEYTRDIHFDTNAATSSYFALRDSQQGGGIGKQLLAANVATYQRLGLDHVNVHADIDIGGYAWAKYGYVPNQYSWDDLSGSILNRIEGSGGGGSESYTPDSWESLSDRDQEKVFDSWAEYHEDEFLDSEIESWRDSGQPLEDAKKEMASTFNFSRAPASNEWAYAGLKKWRETREQYNHPPVPFTDKEILRALSIDDDYKSRWGDGGSDPEFTFNDELLDELKRDPSQPSLPGIEPEKGSDMLTEKVRTGIETALVKAFNSEAEDRASNVEPPDYLRENIRDSQREYWDSMRDRDRYDYAVRNDLLPSYDIESDEDSDAEVYTGDEYEALRKLANSNDPKAIWAISDSKYGKKLLIDTDWNGVLNLKDKESMDRFNAYVHKAKPQAAAKAA